MYLGLASMFLSALLHLMLMSAVIYMAAPIAFDAKLPESPPIYFVSLLIFTAVTLSIGSVLGLLIKNQAKLTMISQMIFLPSIMLSGIMFPADLLPHAFAVVGNVCPAAWGYQLMADGGFVFTNLWPLLVIFLAAAVICGLLLKRLQAEFKRKPAYN